MPECPVVTKLYERHIEAGDCVNICRPGGDLARFLERMRLDIELLIDLHTQTCSICTGNVINQKVKGEKNLIHTAQKRVLRNN